ncbi:MAG TPA: septal ring lytic transglycosylase RlpA family protein [Flavobacterium sp.]|jgi:rare lipoprotein A
MIYRKTILYVIVILVVLLCGFSFQATGQKVPTRVITQDTINKNALIADSLKLTTNIKLKLLKKNAHASYYADKFNGRRTASGRRFDNKKYTAAHRKLPFGTKVKVTNEANGKSVIVEINDRGPFIKGREIDLSKRAFMDIAGARYGGALRVTIEIVQ